ncbi:MAG: nucleotidyltransferase domain-containing protein [Candidatus Hydrogenedentota bacterium]
MCKEIITNYLNLINSKIDIEVAVLFGSCARNDAIGYTDIDIFIISNSLPKDYFMRLDLLWPEKPGRIDIIPWRPEELQDRLTSGFIMDIFLDGVPIIGDKEFYNIKNQIKQYLLQNNLQRTEFGYHKITTQEGSSVL